MYYLIVFLPFIRCRHHPDCGEHKKKQESPEYEETCNCKFYTSPCLTVSKIGIVLHFEFKEADGLFNFDVDVNPPTIPVRNIHSFDGSNQLKRIWLLKNRHKIRNWRAEWRKSHDMSAAVKLRESSIYLNIVYSAKNSGLPFNHLHVHLRV